MEEKNVKRLRIDVAKFLRGEEPYTVPDQVVEDGRKSTVVKHRTRPIFIVVPCEEIEAVTKEYLNKIILLGEQDMMEAEFGPEVSSHGSVVQDDAPATLRQILIRSIQETCKTNPIPFAAAVRVIDLFTVDINLSCYDWMFEGGRR